MASPSSLVSLLIFTSVLRICHARGTFSFALHRRYSAAVRGVLPVDGLPEEGTLHYYAAMVHRDHFFRARRLAAAAGDRPPLTFVSGNETFRINSFGFLHYAEVRVGTPPASFLVALDTGSDLFWLPCDCVNCVSGFNSSSGVVRFNIYSPGNSSTSKEVPCTSSLCSHPSQCSSPSSTCPYAVSYLSENTSSTGYLVEDVLHLTTNDNQLKPVKSRITLGCGKDQSGAFLSTAAPNGLFGLGIENVSVPSILANEGLTSNSFSLCFGRFGTGRIEFGGKGSPGQSETPINLGRKHPSYNISITQINVGGNVSNLEFSAIFDSGTSFTYLNDPAYSLISDKFDSVVEEKRFTMNPGFPFENCYELRPNQNNFTYPAMNLTMKGGKQFFINHPVVTFVSEATRIVCLAIFRSQDINIIGQNFMTGYNIVFDREKMVLGWQESDCNGNGNENEITNDLPINPSPAPAPSPLTAVNPQANSKSNVNNSSRTIEPPRPAGNGSSKLLLRSTVLTLTTILVPYLFCV